MKDHELQIIQDLMEQLTGEMEEGPEDFESRLGRKKPEGVTIVKVQSDKSSPMLEKAEEKMGMDLDGDREEGEDPRHQAKVFGRDMEEEGDCDDYEDPEESFKQRLMRLRG